MKLVINGQTIASENYTGANGTVIDIQDNPESGLRDAVVSQEYTLTGAAYQIVKAELIDDPNGKNKSIPVLLYEDSCCESDVLLFQGIIRGDTVDWCYEDCSCGVTFIEQTDETLAIGCIKSTLVYDNWNGFQQQVHPRITYCNELRPDTLQNFIFAAGVILNIILALLTLVVYVLSIVVTVINAIANALEAIGINVGGISDFDGQDFIQAWQEWVEKMNEGIVSCGRQHPSPLVRNYIRNVCDKCGIGFSSTILNNPQSDYYNTVYFSAPVRKGTKNQSTLWLDENKPIQTLETFLKQLEPVFNADYKLINGSLHFERKDFFWTGDPFVSYESLRDANRISGKLCLSWRDEQRPAFAKFNYILDAMDGAGNDALGRYNNIIEWNQPYSELQAGYKDVLIQFGACRFRTDGVDFDELSSLSNIPFGQIAQVVNNNATALLLNQGVAFQPKLIIWDGQDIMDARAKSFNWPGYEIYLLQNGLSIGVGPFNNQNSPYHFTEFNVSPNTIYPTNAANTGLYGRFYTIDNPKLIIDLGLSFTFTMYYNCESLQAAPSAKYVSLPMGIGRIRSISVNLAEKSLTITGDV